MLHASCLLMTRGVLQVEVQVKGHERSSGAASGVRLVREQEAGVG